MRAAVIQMASGKSVQVNLLKARELVARAADEGAELVVLPESFAYFGGMGTYEIAQEEVNDAGPIHSFLSDLSKKCGLWLVAGTIPKLDQSRPELKKAFAASTVWSPAGELAAQYNKCHLYDVDVDDSIGRYRESDDTVAGASSVTLDLPFGCLGLSVCYDMRFPELYRILQKQGATMLAVPSAFTYATGKAHWEVLLRARAIENQCFVLAANQGGEHAGGRVTWGHSCIIGPWGDVLCVQKTPVPGVVLADLDFNNLQRVRQQLPCLKHRKF